MASLTPAHYTAGVTSHVLSVGARSGKPIRRSELTARGVIDSNGVREGQAGLVSILRELCRPWRGFKGVTQRIPRAHALGLGKSSAPFGS